MSKYLIGAFGALVGVLVLREAYAKGYNKGVKECTDKLDFIAEVQKLKKKDGES